MSKWADLVAWLRSRPYALTIAALAPINIVLARVRRNRFVPGSVLHVSYMGHVPFETVRLLREAGIRADYLAVGTSAIWESADFQITSAAFPVAAAFREFRLFWRIVARYEIVHSHFMVTMSRTGWEWPILKRMGRKLVIHYRGCEIRDRRRNLQLHPAGSICEDCDYRPHICEDPPVLRRRRLAHALGDAFLVTTPDMRDFAPNATHVKFFRPDVDEAPAPPAPPFRLVHATNHPGIEGTQQIRDAVAALQARGVPVELVVLSGVDQRRVLAELGRAHLSIGKMKMGYYANAQVESLVMGVPAITYIRPEFMTADLDDSGLIVSTLAELESTIEYYVTHPEALAAKRARARASAFRLHDNLAIAKQLAGIYAGATAGAR